MNIIFHQKRATLFSHKWKGIAVIRLKLRTHVLESRRDSDKILNFN